jgi:hypothetical protein
LIPGHLWQAWLQMRQGPRSWPQILLVRELPEIAAATDYVPQNRLAETEKYLANYQRVREVLEQICEINRE